LLEECEVANHGRCHIGSSNGGIYCCCTSLPSNIALLMMLKIF